MRKKPNDSRCPNEFLFRRKLKRINTSIKECNAKWRESRNIRSDKCKKMAGRVNENTKTTKCLTLMNTTAT